MRRSRGRGGSGGHGHNGGGHSGNHGGGHNNNNRRSSGVPSRHQVFDSNGPEIRIRGTAWQVYEKYLALARDAQGSGDRVMAENHLQHAEHYYRIILAIAEATGEAFHRPQQQGEGEAQQQPQQPDIASEEQPSDEGLAAAAQPAVA
jgi:hypothetical protein